MAKKKVLKDEALNEVQGGVNLNELNERVLNFESKTDALAEQVNMVSQQANVLEAQINSLKNDMKAEIKPEKAVKRTTFLDKLFGRI